MDKARKRHRSDFAYYSAAIHDYTHMFDDWSWRFRMEDDGVEHLSAALMSASTPPAVTSLNLSWCRMTQHGAAHLASALEVNTTILKLYVHRNRIRPEGARRLFEALKKNSSLQMFALGACEAAEEDGGIPYVVSALEDNHTVAELKLQDNGIGDKGAQDLAIPLKHHPSITSLDISFNFVGDSGAGYLAEAIKYNTVLKTLNLGNNAVGARGAVSLAALLGANASITELNLCSNRIEPEGAHALGAALKSNTSIITLNLGFTGIGPEGIVSIADALKFNSSITDLHLSGLGLHDNDCIPLGKALASNTSVARLALDHNRIGRKGSAWVVCALKTNSTLLHITFDDWILKGRMYTYVREALGINASYPRWRSANEVANAVRFLSTIWSDQNLAHLVADYIGFSRTAVYPWEKKHDDSAPGSHLTVDLMDALITANLMKEPTAEDRYHAIRTYELNS